MKLKVFKKLNLDKKYDGKVHTCQQYFELPKEEREVKKWYWPTKLFLWPFAMSASFDWVGDDLNVKKVFFSEWEKFYKQIRKEYPVQSFFRLFRDTEFYRFFATRIYSFKIDYYYPTKSFFFRRNKHISKVIPNGYENPETLIAKILYAFFLKAYGSGVDSWKEEIQGIPSEQNIWPKMAEEFDSCYQWITVEKAMLEKKIEDAWTHVPTDKRGKSYQELYSFVDQFEKELEDKETYWLNFIVKNRSLMD